MGGDGLISAVAGELRHTDGVLAVLPGGRGNDFARKLGLGSDPVAACDVLAEAREQRIDVADIDGRAYLGIASSGLDSDAGDIANATRLKLGQLVYVYATLRAVRAWRPARWEVVIDGAPHSFSGYSVAVANSGVFGGGMYLAPDAKLDDGLLDVVMIHDLPKRTYLAALPKVFTGAHVREPGVEMCQAREVAFHADRPFNVQADGDPIADLPATVRVQPGALRVLAP
jgi:YegS/Rv2252/BmrU family lipid kinase